MNTYFKRQRFIRVQSDIIKLEQIVKEGNLSKNDRQYISGELAVLYSQRRNISRKLNREES